MEEELRRSLDGCPQLLHLIRHERSWMVKTEIGGGNGFGVGEEKILELRLGPPGEDDWVVDKGKREDHSVKSLLSLGGFSKVAKSNGSNSCAGAMRGFLGKVESNPQDFYQQQEKPGFIHLQINTNGRRAEQQSLERKGCGPPATLGADTGKATVDNNSSQTSRTATAPVVGWPPIRSFRKNLACSSKTQNGNTETASKIENTRKGLFVKINMEGIPIGRKVDLRAYDSYEKLSLAVHELFRGLLAAQRDPLSASNPESSEEKQAIAGLLDGSGEYTLVYEDEEGDRILVGDVPWDMFVSTARRLRVLKSSDISAIFLRTVGRKRTANEH
ncbi:auxin-responsive protein IAA16-like isoform X1 [Typha latifolia]|uniref:auxin-responsive protein IAA16-like isoform X1 n=1 Tax=Typha latifolia TaxID=4733 RepID=UPI003C2D2120